MILVGWHPAKRQFSRAEVVTNHSLQVEH